MKTIKVNENNETFAPQKYDHRGNLTAWREDFPNSKFAETPVRPSWVVCANCSNHIDLDEINDSFCPNCKVFADFCKINDTEG